MTKGSKKKKKASSQSDHTNHSSDISKAAKVEFSINDLIGLSTKELSSKIFTFDKKLATQDLTKMVDQNKNLDVIIRNLPSMKGIDDEYIPKFKFLQIKKSLIKSFNGE